MSDPKPRPIPDWVAFLLAFIAGYLTTWTVLLYGIIGMFGDQRGGVATAFLLMPFFPLAGLAVFQLLFGMTGRWRGWRFWVIAIPVVYAIMMLTGVPALQDKISWAVSVAGCAVLLLLAGFWALSITKPAD